MKQRNYSIDILKFICAVLVVFIHTDFKWHNAILPFTRCAVPCFLMISGYLLYSEGGIGQERLKRNIRHILHILLWSTLLFFVYTETWHIVHGKLFVPTIRQWVFFIILNENPFAVHLWYLGAYIYVLLIMLIVDKCKLWKYMLWITPILLIANFIILNKELNYVYARNFLFMGIPYFMIGVWCKKISDKLLKFNRYFYSGGGVILFVFATMLEKIILQDIGMNPMREHYISTTFLSICLFMFILSFQSTSKSKISTFGERDSLYIYVLHPLLVMVLLMIFKRLPNMISTCYQYTAPFIVLVATIVFTLFLRRFKIIN